jgi:hypothetical protein
VVVADHELEVRVGLGEDTGDALVQIRKRVVDRHHDADGGREDRDSLAHSRAVPAVSILMPVRDGARFLDAAIESAIAQDFEDFELIAVDDGSVDETPAILRRWPSAILASSCQRWTGRAGSRWRSTAAWPLREPSSSRATTLTTSSSTAGCVRRSQRWSSSPASSWCQVGSSASTKAAGFCSPERSPSLRRSSRTCWPSPT